MTEKGKGNEPAGAEALMCPLCRRHVPGEGGHDEAPATLNRHFETDCTWRHTHPSPTRPPGGW